MLAKMTVVRITYVWWHENSFITPNQVLQLGEDLIQNAAPWRR